MRHSGAYLLDRRLLTFNFGGTLGLTQQQTESVTATTSSKTEQDGDLSDYNVSVGVLPGNETISASLYTNRSESIQLREFAGRSESENENTGVILYARRLYIPSTLSFQQQRRENFSETSSITTRTEERRDIVTYTGRRGWLNAEMDIYAEHNDKIDIVRPELNFESDQVTLRTSIDFGSDLNRRWDSRIRWYNRDSVSSDEERIDVDELLELRHSDSLRTDYRYQYNDSRRPTGESTRQTASFRLRHQLYQSLTSNFQLSAVDESQTNGQRNIYRASSDFSYNKRLPLDGRLHTGLSLAYAQEHDDFLSPENFVLQEQHIFATPFALPVTLDNPFVVSGTVVIEKTAEGPTPPGCIPAPQIPIVLQQGSDYTLRSIGNIVEIVPIDCTLSPTGVGINPGDTIAVDYRYATPATRVFATKSLSFSTSMDYKWIQPFYRFRRQDQDLLEGSDGQFLDHVRSDAFGVELRYRLDQLDASMSVEREQYESRDQNYEQILARQQLSYQFSQTATLGLHAQQTEREFTFPEHRQTDTSAIRASMNFRPNRELSGEVFISHRKLKDTLVADERRFETGGRLIWGFGKLRIDPSLRIIEVERWQGGFRSETRELRLMVNMTRNFF